MKRVLFLLALVCLLLVGAAAAESSTLVACFSCTGNTARLARYAAEVLQADYYEIIAEDPYTEEDLACYTDGRCDREQVDPDVRPAISGSVQGMEKYDTVIIAHPIWHGQAPRIISTFLESYSFEGKNLVTMCTSHSSPLGSSAENLHKLVKGAAWLESRRFGSNADTSTVKEWLDSIGLKAPEGKKIEIRIGENKKTATLSANKSAEAFYDMLGKGQLVVDMHDYGCFEKVGSLGTDIVRSDEKITTTPGDIILYLGSEITIYYAKNTYTFTLLGHIDGATADNMKEFLGNGNPAVTFSRQTYPVIWKNWDDTELEKKDAEYGTVPKYTGAEPEKTDKEGYTYTFSGWLPEVQAVSGPAEYVAQFTENAIENPTPKPTEKPTVEPTSESTQKPTNEPTAEPTLEPTPKPTDEPTVEPTLEPTPEPTAEPTLEPTPKPTETTMPVVGAAVYKLNIKKQTASLAAPKKKNITEFSIPASITVNGIKYKVTEIAANAFSDCKKLKSITIGKNVKTIGKNAFSGCTKIQTISGGANVETIGNYAFQKCTSLTKISIRKYVTKIGKGAFSDCKKMKTITIKADKLTKKGIGKDCFKGISAKAVFKCPKKQLKTYTVWLKKTGGTPETSVFK